MAAATGLMQSGLFNGQGNDFFRVLFDLAEEADKARRML